MIGLNDHDAPELTRNRGFAVTLKTELRLSVRHEFIAPDPLPVFVNDVGAPFHEDGRSA